MGSLKKYLLIGQLLAPNLNKISIGGNEYPSQFDPSLGSLNQGLSFNLKSFLLEQSCTLRPSPTAWIKPLLSSSLWNRGKKHSDSMHGTCICSSQTKITEKRKWKPRSFSQLIAAGKGKRNFLQWGWGWISTTLQSRLDDLIPDSSVLFVVQAMLIYTIRKETSCYPC